MNQAVLHPLTKIQFEQYIHSPTQGLLLSGSEGSGKYFVARNIVSTILKTPPEGLDNHPYVMQIRSDNESISVDTIRSLQHFLKLKVSSAQPIARAIIIENAGNLTVEAQNAFLKLLEEPPADTIIVMTVSNVAELLPTVLSRVQTIALRTPRESDIVRHFEKAFPMTEITRALHISGGLIGLMDAILHHDEHPLLGYIDQAKKLYTADTFERMLFVDEFIKSKQDFSLLLDGLYIVSRAALKQAATKNNTPLTKRWFHIQKQLFTTQASLSSNPQTKLALSNLMLHL